MNLVKNQILVRKCFIQLIIYPAMLEISDFLNES